MSTDPSDPLAPSTQPEQGDQPDEARGPGGLDEPTLASNPSSGGPQGLAGDMGISSERTGPAGEDPRGSDIAGTGSKGGAVQRTDGGFDTSPTPFDAPDVSGRDLNPMPEGSEKMTGAGNDPMGQGDPSDIDRTVGEPMPNPIPDEKSRR